MGPNISHGHGLRCCTGRTIAARPAGLSLSDTPENQRYMFPGGRDTCATVKTWAADCKGGSNARSRCLYRVSAQLSGFQPELTARLPSPSSSYRMISSSRHLQAQECKPPFCTVTRPKQACTSCKSSSQRDFKVMPHWHPEEWRTTVVLSGTIYFGVGKQWDESKLRTYPAGTFYSEPPEFRTICGPRTVRLSSMSPRWGLQARCWFHKSNNGSVALAYYAASVASSTGFTMDGSSFSGLLTRVEISHIEHRLGWERPHQVAGGR